MPFDVHQKYSVFHYFFPLFYHPLNSLIAHFQRKILCKYIYSTEFDQNFFSLAIEKEKLK